MERGLFGANARADVHVPVVITDRGEVGPTTLCAQVQPWWTLYNSGERIAPSRVPTTGGSEVALGLGVGTGEVQRWIEGAYREAFGHDVWAVAVGFGSDVLHTTTGAVASERRSRRS